MSDESSGAVENRSIVMKILMSIAAVEFRDAYRFSQRIEATLCDHGGILCTDSSEYKQRIIPKENKLHSVTRLTITKYDRS